MRLLERRVDGEVRHLEGARLLLQATLRKVREARRRRAALLARRLRGAALALRRPPLELAGGRGGGGVARKPAGGHHGGIGAELAAELGERVVGPCRMAEENEVAEAAVNGGAGRGRGTVPVLVDAVVLRRGVHRGEPGAPEGRGIGMVVGDRVGGDAHLRTGGDGGGGGRDGGGGGGVAPSMAELAGARPSPCVGCGGGW